MGFRAYRGVYKDDWTHPFLDKDQEDEIAL